MKILIVEDDERIAEALAEALADQHYTVDTAADGEAGWDLVEAFPYDLVLLDVMLPKLDGIQFCQQLRDYSYRMPVLMLTARDTSMDKVMGLDAGADDYVVKPFDLEELSARIRALLRRGGTTTPPVLKCGSLQLDPSSCEVTYRDRSLNLTPKEYSLLELFLRNRRRVFSRSAILESLWSFEEPPEEDTVKAHVKGLRQKLKAVGAPANFIETIYGLGYRLKQTH
jgi:two-component system OmpR family response regulator